LAPTIASRPPVKTFWRSVLPLSRVNGDCTLPARHGVSLIIGASRSFDQASAISTVGCTTRIGAGS